MSNTQAVVSHIEKRRLQRAHTARKNARRKDKLLKIFVVIMSAWIVFSYAEILINQDNKMDGKEVTRSNINIVSVLETVTGK